jgi:hypothetical protein
LPDQLHCEPLAPFVCSSAMLQVSAGAAGLPLTVACNVTWPPAGIVTAGGETVTVTLLGSKLLPPPQPATTISRTSDSTKRARDKLITDLQQEDHLNFLGSQAVGILHPSCLPLPQSDAGGVALGIVTEAQPTRRSRGRLSRAAECAPSKHKLPPTSCQESDDGNPKQSLGLSH